MGQIESNRWNGVSTQVVKILHSLDSSGGRWLRTRGAFVHVRGGGRARLETS